MYSPILSRNVSASKALKEPALSKQKTKITVTMKTGKSAKNLESHYTMMKLFLQCRELPKRQKYHSKTLSVAAVQKMKRDPKITRRSWLKETKVQILKRRRNQKLKDSSLR